MIKVKCEICGMEFPKRKYEIKNTKHNYCSEKCAIQGRVKVLRCRYCGSTDLVKNNKSSVGYRRICKNCMSKDIKEYYNLKKREGKCVRCGKEVDRKITLCNLCIKKDTTRFIKKRKLNKIRAVKYLGEVCKECGLKSNIYGIYDFHHSNKDKEFGLCNEMGHSWEKIKKELDKCELLCANCHRTKHWNLKNGN